MARKKKKENMSLNEIRAEIAELKKAEKDYLKKAKNKLCKKILYAYASDPQNNPFEDEDVVNVIKEIAEISPHLLKTSR